MKVIKVDGTMEELEDTSLKGMQEAVGGYIEVVNLSSDKILVVNEEGLIKQLPVNISASDLAGQIIVGDAIIANKGDIE